MQLDDDIFYKHSKICWKLWQKLHKHMSHFQFFCYNLKSIKEVTSLYSLRRLAQRNRVLVDFISDPFVKFFLFPFDISGKFLKLCVFSGNIKKVFHNWESYIIYNMYISTINLCNFISKLIWLWPLTILKDLSCTLLIKLLEGEHPNKRAINQPEISKFL